MKTSIQVCVLMLLATKAFAQEPAALPASAVIHHVPLNEVLQGDATLVFEVKNPQLAGAIEVHVVKDAAHASELTVTALRDDTDYVARVPAARVSLSGFAYYVVEQMPDGSTHAVFADAGSPHPVHVTRPAEVEDELQRAAARGGQRSLVLLSAEGIDYGDRRLVAGQPKAHDRYYRLEAGYAYSFFTHVEAIRLTLVRVRGEAAIFNDGAKPTLTETQPGIDYGRAEVTLLGTEELRLRAAVLLGASQRGFEYGGGAAVMLGDPYGMNLDLGVEQITTLGTTGHLRMGLLACERVPMGASIEVSSFPVGDDAGVRLLYDVGYRFGPVTQLSVRAGYQGRTSVSGGLSLGAAMSYGF
jgi:hypothetical protein